MTKNWILIIFLIIDWQFSIPAVIAQIFNPIAELVITTKEYQLKKEKQK